MIISVVKNQPASAGDSGLICRLGRSLGEANGNHSNILAWKIPCTKEPGRLQFMGSQRIGHGQVVRGSTLTETAHPGQAP